MKKIWSIALAAALTLCMGMTAFAAEVNESTEPKTVNTEITTSVAPTYTVTIPADTEIEFNAVSTDLGSISLDAAQINPNYVVTVSANAGVFSNEADAQKTIPYKLTAGADEFASAEYMAAGESTALKIAIEKTAWEAASAGDYSGTITFTVAYSEKSN